MDFMLALAGIAVISIVFLYISLAFRLPSIVSFLVIGMLAGPYGFALIENVDSIETFGEIGIMLLLFTIGLEFSFDKLLRSWRTVIIGGLVQLVTTVAAITFVAQALGVPPASAFVFGLIISLSSTAIVMKVLQERRELDTLQGRTLLGILIFQDLAIIPMILILPHFMGSGGSGFSNLPLTIVKVAGILCIVIVLSRWVIPGVLYRVARQKSRELFFITVAGLCIVIAWITNQAGLSYTLGAFIAGLIIGESDYNIDALSHIIPFRDVFAAIFFLSIGMLLDTDAILGNPGFIILILIIVTLIIGIKVFTGIFAASVLGMPARIAIITGFALCQVGEFSFVLAKSGLDAGFIPEMIYQLFLASAIITMALTPVFMQVSPRAVGFYYRMAPARNEPGSGSGAGMTDATGLLSDHIVIAGYGITGKSVARAAEITGIPYTVIELNPDVIRRERSARHPFFIFGDAMQEEVLGHAGICRARALVVVVSAQEAIPHIVHKARAMAPSLYIIARTEHVRNAQYLLDLGADEVISEEYESAKEIFTRTLRKYQLPESEIGKIVAKLQEWGYAKFVKNGQDGNSVPGMDEVLSSLRIHMLTVEPKSPAEGKTLADLRLKEQYGIADCGLRRNGDTSVTADAATRLQAGDSLIVFCSDRTIREIAGLFGQTYE
ncbi:MULTISPECIES: cation:proton antiporter [unclassified Methanoregula]|uniref:cation:proton antiporter domain-containing protein n=1 Tax=unclassified Methanoregula TaxID=2649730 RepID=UPI0009CBC0BF|nr:MULTISPECIES: cation:proton antiporter [unclassified Methanoregula]OPX63650.1 MAG: glutathione-regulated potassium-efflux system protein KefC [Methanoregula sp. PtaB.Bin085]OPY36184.1 MAG: glutathione-regulated potassium-efflux system protein KefC [Methanoregula sp. PtaU1.Bin006]